MIRTQVQLTQEQAQTLKSLAAARKSSVSDLIRQSIDHLIRQSAAVGEDERRRRAIAAAGRFHSGQRDISIEFDRDLCSGATPVGHGGCQGIAER